MKIDGIKSGAAALLCSMAFAVQVCAAPATKSQAKASNKSATVQAGKPADKGLQRLRLARSC